MVNVMPEPVVKAPPATLTDESKPGWPAWFYCTLCSALLGLCMLLLLPFRYLLQLEINNTAALYLLSCLILQFLVAFEMSLLSNIQQPKVKALTIATLFGQMVGSLLFCLTGFYLVIMRVGEYAFTSNRLVALILCVLVFFIALIEIFFLLQYWKTNRNDASLRRHLVRVQLASTIVFIAIAVLAITLPTLNLFSAQSQIDMVARSKNPDVTLDRDYLSKLGLPVAKKLVKNYAQASLRSRADIVLSLSGMANTYAHASLETTQLSQMIQDIKQQEPAPAMQDFIQFVHDTHPAVYHNNDWTTACLGKITLLLSLDADQASQFCTAYHPKSHEFE